MLTTVLASSGSPFGVSSDSVCTLLQVDIAEGSGRVMAQGEAVG